jgi:hypothetical protein
MWASHGLDRFCVRPYLKLGPEFQVMFSVACVSGSMLEIKSATEVNKQWILPTNGASLGPA